MAEGNVASRSRHEARERIRLITEELARRSRSEHLKAEAGALRDRLTTQAKAKAQEKADELKARAREVAREKALNVKEQMMAKPVALGILGGVAGAVVGALLGRRAEESQHFVRAGSIETTGVEASRWERRRAYDIEGGAPYYGEREVVYDEATARGYPHAEGEAPLGTEQKGRVAGAVEQGKEKVAGAVEQGREKVAGAVEHAKERVSGAMGHAREKAEDLKERAKDAVGGARERIGEKAPSMQGVKSRASGLVREDPMMLAFGAMAFGAFLGLVMPLSDRERRALRSAHLKAKEGLRTGVERAQEMISEKAGEVVPSLLGAKGAKKEERGERLEQREAGFEERETGEDLGARPGGIEPPAIH